MAWEDHIVRRVGVRAVKAVYPRFGLRHSDIILAAFPKTGSTWVRFILANIVSIKELGGRRVDYNLLNGDLAAEYDPHRYPKIEYRILPRFVKTHMEYERKRFGRNQALYVCRNPGDTMVSYFEYLRARKGRARYTGDFKSFIRDARYGIQGWCRHVLGWRDKATAVLTYEGMKVDGVSAMKSVFEELGVSGIDDELLMQAIRRSSFSAVRKMEETTGLDSRAERHLDPGFRFARKGVSGEWKHYFDDEDVEYLRRVANDLGLTEDVLCAER